MHHLTPGAQKEVLCLKSLTLPDNFASDCISTGVFVVVFFTMIQLWGSKYQRGVTGAGQDPRRVSGFIAVGWYAAAIPMYILLPSRSFIRPSTSTAWSLIRAALIQRKRDTVRLQHGKPGWTSSEIDGRPRFLRPLCANHQQTTNDKKKESCFASIPECDTEIKFVRMGEIKNFVFC